MDKHWAQKRYLSNKSRPRHRDDVKEGNKCARVLRSANAEENAYELKKHFRIFFRGRR